jgi:hypothetical protein
MQIFLHSTGEKASEVSAGLTIGDFGRIFTERLGNFVAKLEVFPAALRPAAFIFDIVPNRDSKYARYNITDL